MSHSRPLASDSIVSTAVRRWPIFTDQNDVSTPCSPSTPPPYPVPTSLRRAVHLALVLFRAVVFQSNCIGCRHQRCAPSITRDLASQHGSVLFSVHDGQNHNRREALFSVPILTLTLTQILTILTNCNQFLKVLLIVYCICNVCSIFWRNKE